MVSTSRDGTLRVWDFQKCIHTVYRCTTIFTILPDDCIVCVMMNADIHIIDPEDFSTSVLVGHRDEISCLNISSQEATLISGDIYGNAIVWDLVSKEKRKFPQKSSVITCITILPNGQIVIDHNQLTLLDEDRKISAVCKNIHAILPDGRLICSFSNQIKYLRIYIN